MPGGNCGTMNPCLPVGRDYDPMDREKLQQAMQWKTEAGTTDPSLRSE